MARQSLQNDATLRRDAEAAAAAFPAMMLEAERIAQTLAAGLHGRRRAGPGETFWQHRPYGFGDPINAIDWRQSARSQGRLYVRQNEWEAAASLWLWRDSAPSLDYASQRQGPTKAHRADILATALSILLSQAGERVGLIGLSGRAFHGRGAPARVLEALLGARSIDGAPQEFGPPRQATPAGAKILLISDFYDNLGAIERACAYYAGLGASGALLQIVDPAEEDFPFRGRTEFSDMAGGRRLTFGEAGAVAANYRAQFIARRDALERLAQRFGWTMIAHRTDRPAQSALLALFTAIAARTSLTP